MLGWRRVLAGGKLYGRRRSPVDRVVNSIDVVERLLFAGELPARPTIDIGVPGPAVGRRRKRRDRSRADIFGRIEIELHQRHMLAIAVTPEEVAGKLGCRRIDGSPAGKTRGQYLERQYRRGYADESFVGFLCASRRRRLAQGLSQLAMLLDERTKPRLPEHVRQARKAVHLMIALNQAPALFGEIARQEVEIEIVQPIGCT